MAEKEIVGLAPFFLAIYPNKPEYNKAAGQGLWSSFFIKIQLDRPKIKEERQIFIQEDIGEPFNCAPRRETH